MQEISPHVYIENAYAGVTLGAINWHHGLILIDAPFRAEDARSWRSALLNLGGGVDRLLINLDSHLDRTLGVRAMDCTVVGHDRMVQVYKNRPVTFKAQPSEAGAEWELFNSLGSVRWAPPEITFTHSLYVHWNNEPLTLENRPGVSPDAIWVLLPEKQVVFVGDAVVHNQPPFIANAHIPTWITQLNELLTPEYRESYIISGRGGLVNKDDVLKQRNFLEKIFKQLGSLAERNASPEDTFKVADRLLTGFEIHPEYHNLYRQRLHYGLYHYYVKHYQVSNEEASEE